MKKHFEQLWGVTDLPDTPGKTYMDIINTCKVIFAVEVNPMISAPDSGIVRKAIELWRPTEKQVERRKKEESDKIDSSLVRQAEDFAKPEEKFYWWFSQLDKCIKCYGCCDACPLCHCKRCVLYRDVPETVTKGVVPPSFTFGAIQLLHVAAYCVNCGQCDDVCSVDIPLSKFAHNLSKVASNLFHYVPGEDKEAPLPYADIPEDEKRLQSPDLQERNDPSRVQS